MAAPPAGRASAADSPWCRSAGSARSADGSCAAAATRQPRARPARRDPTRRTPAARPGARVQRAAAPAAVKLLQRLADARAPRPVGHRPRHRVHRVADCGMRSWRVMRVSRVENRKASTRRWRRVMACAKWSEQRRVRSIDPLTSQSSTIGRGRTRRTRRGSAHHVAAGPHARPQRPPQVEARAPARDPAPRPPQPRLPLEPVDGRSGRRELGGRERRRSPSSTAPRRRSTSGTSIARPRGRWPTCRPASRADRRPHDRAPPGRAPGA